MGSNETPAKAQPWKEYWLAMDHRDKQLKVEGTSHGFAKGEEVIMDGNANGHSLDVITQTPAAEKEKK